jgi:fucose permease
LRSSVLVWSLIVFFVYVGIASGAGVWAFTYLTEERGIGDGLSGVIVAAYWGGFTASRLLLGAVGDRFRPDTALRWSAAGTVAAFGVFWWSPATWLSAVALVCAGFAHGPVFPLEILLTPRRFGAALTATVVGFEIAAANVGGAVVPGLIGLAVGRAGLGVIPPLLVVNALVLWAAIEMLRRQSPEAARSAMPLDGGHGTSG